jgi:hypothetical protein
MITSKEAREALEYATWLLEAQRELDAMFPESRPIAPPGPTPLEREQVRQQQLAYVVLQATGGRAADGRPVADPAVFDVTRAAATEQTYAAQVAEQEAARRLDEWSKR